ncbi:60S ribosomal protein L24 [Desmophyllum pertusum]|uniref:Large ribosomal subunit protein eL24 n=1 Tax=Desmophyllum pertusum TaxID=174260 RepID=A0A9W9ZBD2_9CNID|nr:60S ribosomal protein L24 [Desmophyllum pertusum]
MKLELCNYSGYKIYPGHGKRYIRLDGKVFNFLSKKCERALLMHRNPRKISWTVLYRRKHKKGSTEEVAKKRTRRNIKFQRSVQGATLENILAKRNQKPEVRKASVNKLSGLQRKRPEPKSNKRKLSRHSNNSLSGKSRRPQSLRRQRLHVLEENAKIMCLFLVKHVIKPLMKII